MATPSMQARAARHGGLVRPPGPALSRGGAVRTALAVMRGRAAPFTEVFERLARDYGDIADLRTPEHSYLVSHPDLVRQVLIDDQPMTHKGRGVEFLRLLLGNGLLTAEGDEHRAQRRRVAPAFGPDHVRSYSEAMLASSQRLSEDWARHAETSNAPIDMMGEMSALALRIAGKALVGRDLADRTSEVSRALGDALAALRYVRVPGATLVLRGPTPWAWRLRRAVRALHTVVDAIIDEHRAHPERFAPTVLTGLLESVDDEGRPLSPAAVRDQVLTLLLAGHETTATLLTWAWVLLDQNPDAARRLHGEVDTLSTPLDPSALDPLRLPYTRAVVAETLRLYPSAWAVGRRYTGQGSLRGYRVPDGTEVLVSQWVLHRDPRWWGPDVLDFRPQRWLTDQGFDPRAPGQPHRAYVPFGAGRRVCVGEQFAWTEATLVLACLARTWAPTLATPGPVPVDPAITLRPRGPVPMRLQARR